MKPISAWRDLLEWSPPSVQGRVARIERFAALFDLYREVFDAPPPIVKITGTSGKGSVGAMLEAALINDEKTVGLFTSPHLVLPTERIRIGGRDVSSEALDEIAVRTGPFFQRILGKFGTNFRPTFFEALLVLAFRLFAEAHCNVAIMEVAIGGSNDVLSLVPGPVSAITSVGLDHLNELGSTLSDIARDKAGIATSGSTLVIGPTIDGVARAEIEQDADRRGIRLVAAAGTVVRATDLGLFGHNVEIATQDRTLTFHLPLAGSFQIDNFKTAYTTLRVLKECGVVTRSECIVGVTKTRWPARLEFFPGRPSWILDSAHNSMALGALSEFLHRSLPKDRNRNSLLLGASDSGRIVEALHILGPLFPEVHLVGGFFRAAEPHAIKGALPAFPPEMRYFVDPESAVRSLHARCSGEEHCVVVAGSIYLAGACRSILMKMGYITRYDH